jgi:hypothetical protein
MGHAMSDFTADEITEAIASAIKACDFPAVEALLRRLAVTDPAQAQRVYDTIQAGLAVTP